MEPKTRIISQKDKSIEIEIDDEDSSLGDILHHELLKNRNVSFAGVITPHPLIRRPKIKVETSHGKPVDALASATDKAKANLEELAQSIRKGIKSHR